MICWANQSWPWSWLIEESDTYVGVAVGADGAFGSIVSPESALISLRKMVRPAPPDVLYRYLSTCCWTDDDASMTVDAWPNPSETPKPAIVWYVVAPLIAAVSAASAGGPRLTSAATSRPPAASGRTFETFEIFGYEISRYRAWQPPFVG